MRTRQVVLETYTKIAGEELLSGQAIWNPKLQMALDLTMALSLLRQANIQVSTAALHEDIERFLKPPVEIKGVTK